MSLLASLFALSAGALFGLNVYIQRRGLDDIDGLTGAFFSVATMAAFLWFLSPFFVTWRWWFSDAAVIFLLCGLFFPASGQGLQIASIARVGPALTSAVGAFAPLFAVLPAVFFLGESFGFQAQFGLMLMIALLVVLGAGLIVTR